MSSNDVSNLTPPPMASEEAVSHKSYANRIAMEGPYRASEMDMLLARQHSEIDAIDNKVKNHTFIGAGLGALFGFLGGAGARYWINNRLIDFEQKIETLTRTDIMARTSAGVSAVGDNHNLYNKHYMDAIKESGNEFARFIHNIGGKGVVPTVVGLAVGAAVFAGYGLTKLKSLGRKSKEMDRRHTIEINALERAQSATAPVTVVQDDAPVRGKTDWAVNVKQEALPTAQVNTLG